MNGHIFFLFAILAGVALAGKPKAGGQQFTTAPQCKCKDIVECAHDLLEKTNKCKVSSQCEPFIKKIGNSGKIRACLDKEQKEMEKLEKCVEKKVGPVGCTNDEHPKNLTIPVMPQMDQAAMEAQAASQPQQPGQAPPEMGSYLMCVDKCAMEALEKEAKGHHRQRRSPMNCANKLRSVRSTPESKTLTQMQYKNSPDQMELTLNFRTGEAHLHRPNSESHEKANAHHDPKFPLLHEKGDQMQAPFKRAKPPFYLKETKHKKKKHRGKGKDKHHHASTTDHHPHAPVLIYENGLMAHPSLLNQPSLMGHPGLLNQPSLMGQPIQGSPLQFLQVPQMLNPMGFGTIGQRGLPQLGGLNAHNPYLVLVGRKR